MNQAQSTEWKEGMTEPSGACLSPCRTYRFALWRIWDYSKPMAVFIGLNPSTADESEDDPTIRRCKRFASDWGCGGMVMLNLFAVRATDPKVMMKHSDPVGYTNDNVLRAYTLDVKVIVCAWGAHGGFQGRDKEVIDLLSDRELKCLGTTKDGKPRHPLYIRADKELEVFGV